MSDTIKKCTCGSTNFWLTESLLWSGSLEDGSLDLKNKECSIEKITCCNCDKEYTEAEFDGVEINFN